MALNLARLIGHGQAGVIGPGFAKVVAVTAVKKSQLIPPKCHQSRPTHLRRIWKRTYYHLDNMRFLPKEKTLARLESSLPLG